ncbi:probable membrane-associated kinase regulator 2 [Solanum lycopersicum]|uniref:Membrane-associated kinase regulator 5 n=1 Tax=Solanum lycopersicum TaxID=4081 RepID=A0A3Q7FGD7_SOLLC|nr:probable membrane-associated kinase regulator 2 [Solanum lycopersicum]
MKTFKLLKCWPNADPNTSTVADTDNVPYFDSVKNLIYGIDYVTNPDEDSFFDLVFTGPDGRPKVVCNSKSVKQRKIGEFDSPIDSQSKSPSPVSVLGSGIVFLFRFRKSNSDKAGIDEPKQLNKTSLHRGSSLRSKLEREREEEFSVDESAPLPSKQFARAKFLKLVKRGNSKMCTDKIRLSDQVSTPFISSSRKQLDEKQGNRVAAFGAVCKHVMKSRSTTSSFAGVSSSLPPMNRRDDSLLEQNDGIQGAILHCKRSYSTASKDCSIILPRCTTEDVARTSCYEEESRWSI